MHATRRSRHPAEAALSPWTRGADAEQAVHSRENWSETLNKGIAGRSTTAGAGSIMAKSWSLQSSLVKQVESLSERWGGQIIEDSAMSGCPSIDGGAGIRLHVEYACMLSEKRSFE